MGNSQVLNSGYGGGAWIHVKFRKPLRKISGYVGAPDKARKLLEQLGESLIGEVGNFTIKDNDARNGA